jgi:hypothetical protein
MAEGFSGRCLCGAVSYESAVAPLAAGHCHCIDCRKSSGSGHCTHVMVPADALTVSGVVTFYDRAADSGNVVRRGFCGACGSALYSTNAGTPDLAFVRASSLDDPEIAAPAMVVYASRAPSWDHVDSKLPSFSQMPPRGPSAALPDAG